MYIIYVNHDSVIKQICQLRDKAFLINETLLKPVVSTMKQVGRQVLFLLNTKRLIKE